MVKSKRKRGRTNKPQPTGLPSMTDMDEQEEMLAPISGTINNLIEKLQSPSSEERECTCTIIAGLVEQAGSVPQLMRTKAVKVLGPLLLDPNWALRKAAVGALRNVSVEGGSETCEEMVKQDVMTSLVSLLQQYEKNWVPSSTSKPDIHTEVFDQSLHLLWNLCEVSETAVKIFTQQNLALPLLRCINYETHGYSIALAAAECLYAVSESNPHLSSVLSGLEVRAPLENRVAAEHQNARQLLLTTLCAGILYNSSPGGSAEFHTTLIAVLSKVLDQNIEALLIPVDALHTSLLSNNGPLDAECAMSEGATADTHDKCGEDSEEAAKQKCPLGEERQQMIKHTALDSQLEEASCVMAAQLMALELIANLCCDGDGVSDDEEVWEDSSDTSHEEMGGGGEQNMEEVQGANWSSLCVPGEVHSAFVAQGILQKVMSKVARPDSAICERLASHRKTQRLMKSLDELVRGCLLCLTNLVSGMEVEALGGIGQLHDLWVRLAQIATKQQESGEMMEAVTSAMHAAVLKLAHAESLKLGELTESDMQFLYKLSSSSGVAEVRANCLRIVSAIGQALAKHITPHTMMKPIGLYFIHTLHNEGELWVVAEAVDAIMDVYAEDHLNAVLADIQLLPVLTAMLPQLKLKVKQQKKSLGEHLPVVMTARTNLNRFIQYKTKLM